MVKPKLVKSPTEGWKEFTTPERGGETPLERARRRHGQPFAHEPGSTWKKHSTPFLTQWLSTRTSNAKL